MKEFLKNINKKSIHFLDRLFYDKFGDNWDDQLLRKIVLSHINKGATVLDLGAGAGILPQMNFRGLALKVCGVDPDHRVIENQFLDEGKMGVGESIPYADNTFDVAFANNVLEHLEKPRKVFNEVRRVLKKGGIFIFKTPNRFHYVMIASMFTPTWLHAYYKKKMMGREEKDTFPTFYKANSSAQINNLAKECGFFVEDLKLVEGRPEYLRIFTFTYLLGVVYERTVNYFAWLAPLRVVLYAVLSKR